MFGVMLLIFDWSMCLLQAIRAWQDKYFSQKQLRARGITNAYSHLQHGGWWANIFIISPMVAYITTKYQLAYFSWYSLIIFIVATVFVWLTGYVGYAKKGEEKMPDVMLPDSYVHDKRLTSAGKIHLAFAVAVLYIITMFYFTPLKPAVSRGDFFLISAWLTPFFFMGICKFTRRWTFSKFAQVQVACQLFFVWSVAAIRIMPLDRNLGAITFLGAFVFVGGALSFIYPTLWLNVSLRASTISEIIALGFRDISKRILASSCGALLGGIVGMTILDSLAK
jgi:hypothetical protein